MAYVYKSTHVEEGKNKFIELFRDLPNFCAYLESFLLEVQAIEDAINALHGVTLYTAAGAQLDQYGDLVNTPRDSRSDADYLIAIEVAILLRSSSGTTEEILAIIDKLTGGLVTETTEYYPAGFIMEIITPYTSTMNIANIVETLRRAKDVGVQGIATFFPAGAFQYDGPANTGYDDAPYGGASAI